MSLARNTGFNLLAAVTPVLLSLCVTPFYLELIGTDRFGILAICWTLIGAFGFASLGMGPALAYRLAVMNDEASTARSNHAWMALLIAFVASTTAGFLVLVAGRLYFEVFASVPSALEREIGEALPILAATLPISTLSGVLAGALQGRRRFGVLSGITVANAALGAVAPLLMALLVSAELPMILLALVCGNGLMLLVQLLVCVRILPLERPSRLGKAEARNLVGYGAWMSATALIAPFLLLFDRLLLGSLRGPTAVAVYALAFSVLQALLLIPASLSSAMVPQVGPMKEQAEVRAFQSRCLELLNAILTPMIISAMAFSYLFFRSWIGSNLGSAVAPVAAVLLAGCWLHGIGHVASAIVIGRSRPDLLTKLLLACLLPYLALLYFATAWFGVIGAAAVWALRAAFDPVLFYWTDPSQQDLIPVGSSALLVLLAMTATLVLAWTQPIYWMIMSLLISVSLVRSRGVLMGIPKQWKGLGEGPSTQISGAASQ